MVCKNIQEQHMQNDDILSVYKITYNFIEIDGYSKQIDNLISCHDLLNLDSLLKQIMARYPEDAMEY